MGQEPRQEIPGEAIEAALSRLLASPEFAQSERMCKLLAYLVEATLGGRAGQIKETVIGVDVFGREPGYDPKIDGIVRTEARRLRAKLDEYYGGSGRQETLHIDLPKGAYVPFFVGTAPAPPGGLARSAGPKIWP